MAAFHHANPGLLEEVLGQIAIPCQVDQIAQQPMLILLDETVQQVRIAPAKTTSYGAGLGFHRVHEVTSYGVHATGYTGEGGKKMQTNAFRMALHSDGRESLSEVNEARRQATRSRLYPQG